MKIGLALSGGGMRGVAHIGAIKALEEHGIIPTHIAGTSSGAIVGALYAYGYNHSDILKFFKGIQILDFTKFSLNKPGFLDTEKFYPNFKLYIKEDNFSILKKKLFITATNILSGKLIIFDKGELIKPILASSAFPGLFAPVKVNDSYYVDGGALNNFPVNLLQAKCDKIIGVYVNGFQVVTINDLKHFHNVVERAFKLKSTKDDLKKFKDCDIVISPKELSKYGTFDKKNLDDIFKMGYDSAMEAIKKNKEFYNKLQAV